MTTATRSHKTSVTKNQAHATRPRSFFCKRVAGCLGTEGRGCQSRRSDCSGQQQGGSRPTGGPLETFQKLRGRVGLLWQSRWFHDQNLQMLIATQWFPSPFPNMQLSVTPHMGNDPPFPPRPPPPLHQAIKVGFDTNLTKARWWYMCCGSLQFSCGSSSWSLNAASVSTFV